MHIQRWPTKADYNLAMKDFVHTIQVPALQQGRFVPYSQHRLGRENVDLVCLYKIQLSQDTSVMMRCFCQSNDGHTPMADVFERYAYLNTYQSQLSQVSAYIPITYIYNGIRVDCHKREAGRRRREEAVMMPIVTMPFIAGVPMGDFIETHYRQTQKMEQLRDAWWHMVSEMEAIPLAHGDLDVSNVLVVEQGQLLSLRLVDYDSVYVPGYNRYGQPEGGHPPFQHPTFLEDGTNRRLYDADMDRFSSLVMYLSLLTLSTNPRFHDDYGFDETRLLFSPADYLAEMQGRDGAIARLKKCNLPALAPYLDELCNVLHTPQMPRSLSDIAARRKPEPRLPIVPIVVSTPPPASFVQPVESKHRRVVRNTVWGSENEPSFQPAIVREQVPHIIPASPVPAISPAQYAPTDPQERVVLGAFNTSGNPMLLDESTTFQQQSYAQHSSTQQAQATVASEKDTRSLVIGCLAILTLLLLIIIILILMFNVFHVRL